MRLMHSMVLVAFAATTMAATTALAQFQTGTYDFESLPVGTDLSNPSRPDGWFNNDPTGNTIIVNGDGVDATHVAQCDLFGVNARSQREFSPTAPTGNETDFIMEFDYRSNGLFQGTFGGNQGTREMGVVAIGPLTAGGFGQFGIDVGTPAGHVGSLNDVFSYQDNNGGRTDINLDPRIQNNDWIRIRADVNFTTVDLFGQGSLSLSWADLTQHDTSFTPVAAMQDLPMYATINTNWTAIQMALRAPNMFSDANNDGVTNGLDIAVVASHWLQTGVGSANGDVNEDGVVNGLDIALISANWLRTTPYVQIDNINIGGAPLPGAGGGAAVPEPRSFALAAAASVCLLGYRFRRREKSRRTKLGTITAW